MFPYLIFNCSWKKTSDELQIEHPVSFLETVERTIEILLPLFLLFHGLHRTVFIKM